MYYYCKNTLSPELDGNMNISDDVKSELDEV